MNDPTPAAPATIPQAIPTTDDPGTFRDELLARLADEFLGRYRRGDRPLLEEYARAHPELADEIRETFPAVLLMENPDLDPAPNAASAGDGIGSIVGRYKLLEQIGEGGFGVVFMAEQQHPVRRKVALKVIKPGMDTGQVIARFEAERQALAVMDHENIARVFDAGTTDTGRPYFVMELVPGIPITDYCDRHELTTRERLELFARVCHAVQHAHTKGLIHRDLKPTNVLVMVQDDRPVPKIIDFGVAKATAPELAARSAFTQFAQMVGTPLYMSPEQAQMGGADVDTRSDVYSLGVMLYELLTGSTPFDRARLNAAGMDEVRRMIREEEPEKPSTRLSAAAARAGPSRGASRRRDLRRLGALLRGDLDWIVMKALEKDRSRRYETAVAMARDVERHLRDQPVSARPPSAWYRFRKLARRRKAALAVASALAIGAMLAVAALAVSALLVWRANDDLKQSLGRERSESYFQRIEVAHRELMSSDNLGNALKVLDACPPDLRRWEWDYLARLCRVEPLVLRDGGGGASVAFSPDGVRLASGGADGTVKIWDSRTGRLAHAFPAHAGWVFSVAFHPDGTHVASTGADGKVKVWNLAGDREVFAAPCDAVHMLGSAYTVAFSPDGRRIVAGGNGVMDVWDWQTGALVHALPTGAQRAPTVAFSRDGRRVASGTWQGSVRLWDADKGAAPLRTLTEDRFPVTALAFSPDGGRLAQASFGRRVNVWSTATGELLHALPHTGLVACVAFSPDGLRIASGGEDKTVRVWDAATGRQVLGLRGHTGACVSVAFSPDGRRIVSAGTDGTIRIWDATPLRGDEGQAALTFSRHDNEVWRVALRPDGRQVASGGFRTPVHVWDAATGNVSARFPGHPFVSFDLAWHPDGATIASAGWDGDRFSVKVWDPVTGRDVFKIPAAAELFTVAFSPDGRYLVTAGMSRAIQVWDARTGRAVATLGTHAREIRGITFSPDGRSLASASADGVVKLWDATRLTQPQDARLALRGRVPGQCLNVAFSPDGRRIATGGDDNTVKIWDAHAGRELLTLTGHKAEVYTVAFSPGDGRWLASTGEDSTVKLWDAQTGKPVRSFRGHAALVGTVAFSPDGRRLFSGSRDHTVKVWDLTPLTTPPSTPRATDAE